MVKPYFHFKVIKSFMDKVYREALMPTNIMNDGEELHLDNLWFINEHQVAEEDAVPKEFRDCVLATKGSDKYIVPIQFLPLLPFRVTATLPCYLKKADRKVWKMITGASAILLPPNKSVSIREFTDEWNPIEHTNQQTWTFLKCVSLSTLHMGIKLNLCSEPAAGKGAHNTIIAEITRNLHITSTPSIAKAETSLFYNQTIIFNEMGKPKSEEASALQDFFIWLADQSVRYNKRSMAVKRELNSVDITHKSAIHTYNRKNCLKKDTLFWDDIWANPGALIDRYAQFLVDGRVTESVPDISPTKASDLATEFDTDIKRVVSGLMGISSAVSTQLHHYSSDILIKRSEKCQWGFTPRQLTNVQGLLEYLDAYSQTQDEFNDWLLFLNNAKLSYDIMKRTEQRMDFESQDAPAREMVTHETVKMVKQ
jgi:hypothetical protein